MFNVNTVFVFLSPEISEKNEGDNLGRRAARKICMYRQDGHTWIYLWNFDHKLLLMLRLLCNTFYSLNRVPNKRLAFLFYVRKFFLFPYSELHSSTYIKVHKNVIHTYYFLQFFPHFYSHLSSRLCICYYLTLWRLIFCWSVIFIKLMHSDNAQRKWRNHQTVFNAIK